MRDVTVTESDVLQAISKIKTNAASRPNCVPPVVFKKLKHSFAMPRTLTYNQLLSVAEVPAIWKMVHCACRQKGSTTTFVNYRPISLVSVLSKIL